jgi:hypothetical protein
LKTGFFVSFSVRDPRRIALFDWASDMLIGGYQGFTAENAAHWQA